MKNLNTLNQRFQKAETRTIVERERERERKNKTFLYVLLILLSTPIMLSAQLVPKNNLILNGGFENFTDTPQCTIGLNGLYHWFNPTLQLGAVFCHSIQNVLYPNWLCVGRIYEGYEPHNGNGQLLIALYDYPILPNYWSRRSYIAQKINGVLTKDSVYCFVACIKFRYCGQGCIYTTNKFGVYFSTDSLTNYDSPTGFNNLTVIPQIETDTDFIFIDSLNWVRFKKYYKASGGEHFITIGNFRDDINTPLFLTSDTTISISNPTSAEHPGIYIYIDDVGLYKNECPIETDTTQKPKPVIVNTLQVPTGFTPNNDGKNDVFRVLGSPQLSGFTLQVYNRWGERMFGTNNIYEGWDGTHNGQPCPIDTYQWVATYTLQSTGEQRVERGNVTLMR
jgi:gliding motility-associated-like protein